MLSISFKMWNVGYFFFRAYKAEANVIKRILDMYEHISGQKINYTKSSITFFMNTSVEDKKDVCEQLEVNAVQNPGKYLGMPMLSARERLQPLLSYLKKLIRSSKDGRRRKWPGQER